MNETQEHWQRMTDFGNFNLRGKLLLALLIVLFFSAVVYSGMQPRVGAYDSRGGRKFMGFAFAMFAAGGFAVLAVLLEKVGHSIYKPGRNPFKPGDFSDAENGRVSERSVEEPHGTKTTTEATEEADREKRLKADR